MSDTASINKPRNCPYCGTLHIEGSGKCPLVSAFEYHPNGTLKRVEFYGPAPVSASVPGPASIPAFLPTPIGLATKSNRTISHGKRA